MTTPRNTPSACIARSNDRCSAYGPGHGMHAIHAKHVGRSPWGWRDSVVTRLDGPRVWVQDVESGRVVQLWHHEGLADVLRPGDPVRVHEGYHALGGPFGWLNVLVEDGLGAVPDPVEPALWADRASGAVVDLSTGRAIALDWESRD